MKQLSTSGSVRCNNCRHLRRFHIKTKTDCKTDGYCEVPSCICLNPAYGQIGEILYEKPRRY